MLFSTLILSSSQLLQDQRELFCLILLISRLWLAGCMLEWLSTKIHLQFSSTVPPDAQQYRSASLLMVLQESSTKLAINMQLSTNNAVSLYDILDACLLLLTGEKDGLFGEWFLSIMKMIPMEHDAKQSQFTILNQIHSLVCLPIPCSLDPSSSFLSAKVSVLVGVSYLLFFRISEESCSSTFAK